MNNPKPYEHQLERIKRWKEEIEKELDNYLDNNSCSKNTYILFDMIDVFFIFCHHMADYIINDDSLSVKESAVREYIKENDCLRVCADICNREKHLELRNPKTKGGRVSVCLTVILNARTKERVVFADFKSKIVKQEFSDLSEECIEKWERFIEKERLCTLNQI